MPPWFEELLESELFGHVRGAFTGAVRDRKGRFEQASGGTLFLDEVGDTSAALQAKLLRAVQDKTIEPVGSAASRQVDVRIVSATNKNLIDEVRAGRFREDLYYRLNVVPIHLSPLRERPEDIPLLVDFFVDKFHKIHRPTATCKGVSERALAAMVDYHWPGNVRELEHALEYASISSTTDRIDRTSLPLPLRQIVPSPTEPPHPQPAAKEPARDEQAELEAALRKYQWSVGRTAEALGISRTTLWRRMKRLGIERN